MSELLYIMNPSCGWCKKSDPVVEELRKDGFDITTLDVSNPDDLLRANEAKMKHNAQCGTPLFLDAETGNVACGFKEKDMLMKWAKGEKLPAPPPRPTQPQQQRPQAQPMSMHEHSELKLRVMENAQQLLLENYYNDFSVWSNTSPSRVEDKPKFPNAEMILAEAVKFLSFIR